MKPFAPKLGSARPRVTAALNQAALGQFTPNPPAPQGAVAKKKKPQKSQVSMALQGAF